ncbi:MAG: D-alanyl-D-alanine carboxypeptidase/D-alanyl-D-alanine-endopeptidase [Balneolaceae bacterium]
MFHLIRSYFLLLFFFTANTLFAQDLESIINSAPNQEALWSVTVRDVNGNIHEELNSDKLIIPASNQKLFTTAAVLDGLGSDFRYTTNIYGRIRADDNTKISRLLIKGAGDPSISGIMYGENRYLVFDSFISQIKNKRLSEVTGQILGDESYFDSQIYPKGWDWDDLSFYYGVEISPLSFNNNAVDLVVDASGDIGNKPSISWFPWNTNYVEFWNGQVISAPNVKYDEFYARDLGTNKIDLGSSLPKGYLEEESLSINCAGCFFLSSFDEYLVQKELKKEKQHSEYIIQVSPSVELSGYLLIASHSSEPLSKLIEWTNKESDNFYTEMLLKTLAAEKAGIPGTFENGIKEVRKFLGRMEIDTTYVVMKDGSGMASGNFTKTSILSEFLVRMQNHPEFSSFFNSLSIAGIDGTIAHRMKGTSLYNNFKGKSGYVGGVRTLSGYFTTDSGKELIVSFATNNFIGKVRPIDAVHEQILEYLYAKY